MRRLSYALLAVFALSAASAFANNHDDERIFFRCHFLGEAKGATSCEARGVFSIRENEQRPGQGGNHQEIRNFLEVACDNTLIYKDGLNVEATMHQVVYAGIRSERYPFPPRIVTPIPHGTEGAIAAWLYYDDTMARGFCEFFKRDRD